MSDTATEPLTGSTTQDTKSAKEEVNNNSVDQVQVEGTDSKDSNVVQNFQNSSSKTTLYVLDDSFSIKVTDPEDWLCIARMPLDFSQEEFQDLVKEFGNVERVLLVNSERTGKNCR